MEKKKLTCEMEITIKVIGGKWKPLILHYLQYGGECHFSEILRYLGNVSKKTLSLALDELEADGIITRTVIPTSPVQVTYRATELGETLYPLLHMMCEWGYAHMGDQVELVHPTHTLQEKELLKQITKT